MTDPFKKARSLQTRIAPLTANLAEIIARPFSDRDPAEILEKWHEIDAYRRDFLAINRAVGKFDRGADQQQRKKDDVVAGGTRRYAREFASRVKLWDAMANMVAQHARKTPTELLPIVAPQEDPLVSVLHNALHKLANPNGQSETAQDHGCFADIPMRASQFERLMKAAYRVCLAANKKADLRFLDVGCGGATKTYLASRYFSQCDGLDYDANYVASARRTIEILKADTCHVFQADGLSFGGYDAYDIIYFYRPMRDDALLHKLESKIFETARAGTLILAPYNGDLVPHENFDLAHIFGCIFITGMTQNQADRIRIDAEHTGTEVVTRSSDFSFDTGFWSPLLDASSFDLFGGKTLPASQS